MVSVATVVDDKKSDYKVESKGMPLIQHEPIHYHILPPNEPHPCDMYGCPREAKYKLGISYFCHDKAISHFSEVAEKCSKEGFEVVEDFRQLDI